MSGTSVLKSDSISDFFIINSYLRYQFRFFVLARKAGLSGAYFAAEIGTLKISFIIFEVVRAPRFDST